jgi:aspartyl-tRNA(Asn)/glutamyl-tRNA(Gln) amidotransferase subunit B
LSGDFRRVANWLTGPVQASLNTSSKSIRHYSVSPERLATLLDLEAAGTVSNTAARQILVAMESEGSAPLEIASRERQLQVTDETELDRWVDAVISENPVEAERFRSGERKLLGVLVGLAMKKSGGSADPRRVNQLIVSRLG